MPVSLTKLTSGQVLSASDINSPCKRIEEHMNGGLQTIDLGGSLIKPSKIRPGRFYGSPAPRAEFVSSDVHYRFTGGGTKAHRSWDDISKSWEPVPGLSATIHVAPKTPGERVKASVMANFFARERNGGGSTLGASNRENKKFASFALFVIRGDSVAHYEAGTKRELFCSTENEFRWASKNITMQAVVELDHGINHVYIASRIEVATAANGFRLHVGPRSLVVDVHYL